MSQGLHRVERFQRHAPFGEMRKRETALRGVLNDIVENSDYAAQIVAEASHDLEGVLDVRRSGLVHLPVMRGLSNGDGLFDREQGRRTVHRPIIGQWPGGTKTTIKTTTAPTP